MHSRTRAHMCSPLNLHMLLHTHRHTHSVRLHAHRHWHALEHMHTHVVCDHHARPPRLGHSKAQELPPPLLPNFVTICLVPAKAPAVSPPPLWETSESSCSQPCRAPGSLGSAKLAEVDWKCCGSPPAGWWVRPGGLLKGTWGLVRGRWASRCQRHWPRTHGCSWTRQGP